MVKLITEVVETIRPLVEADEGSKEKKYYIEGIYLQANLQNKNGRIYPREILENEVARYNREYVNKKKSIGELGHPDSPTVNLDRVCHLITELRQDGNNWIGRSKILDTPYGKITKNFIDEGINLGVSSRGMGSLTSRGGVNYVGNDYKIVGVDVVWDPSAPDATVQGIMENCEWVFDVASGDYQLIEDIQRDIRKATSAQMEQKILESFQKFLSSI